jgi:trk system potassium uptake protein TrkA
MRSRKLRVCVLGLGQFGQELAVDFARDCEVLVIDADQVVIDAIANRVHKALCLDVRDYRALSSVVNDQFDEAVVCLSQNMEASILAVLHLRKIGVKRIHAKARNKDHAEILGAVGADNIVFPERDTARRLTRQVLNPNLLDFVPLTEDYSVMQIAPREDMCGRSLKELDLRRRAGVFVIAVKEMVPDNTVFLPSPDFVIKASDVLIAIGHPDQLKTVAARPLPGGKGASASPVASSALPGAHPTGR